MSRFDLAGWLEAERRVAERALQRAVGEGTSGIPVEVAQAVRHGVTGGGKRIRPVLCAASYRACGGKGGDDAVYDMAVSLELVHAYSLMHDDLPCMDDAALRRGRPTTHRVYGAEATTLAGATLIPLAILQALRGARALGCSEDTAREVAREVAQAAGAGGMVGGQVMDLQAEGCTLDAPQLESLHRLKTGALLTASLRTGAVAAGAGPREREALDQYGRAVGLAFQIADDVLDATSTADELGKNPSDALLHKSTWVSVHGLEAARRRGYDEVGSAVDALDAAGLEAPALRALARYVMDRRS